MGGNGKARLRWRISFRRSAAVDRTPPPEFLCPIANSLMSDPVVISSGQTFERVSVAVCRDLGYAPPLSDGSTPDFSAVIPNLALRAAIRNWCSKTGTDLPKPPMYSDIETVVRCSAAIPPGKGAIGGSERELIDGVEENPRVLFAHADTELNPRNLYASSSSEESVIANTTPLLPFATRPSCLSQTSSPSDSAEFGCAEEAPSGNDSTNSPETTEEESILSKLRSLDIFEQEQVVISLRKKTRSDEGSRTALCSDRVLSALKKLLVSRYSSVQANAAAVVVNLSLEKSNKVRIVRAGIVPLLIDVLKNGFNESREHAAGALFSLALEDENRTAIGVLGALPPLLHELRSGTRRSRHDAALAMYHLTLVAINRAKLVRLGATGALLALLSDAEVAARVVLVVCNLAAFDEGRAALLDAGAVKSLAEVLKDGGESRSESTRENCVAALHSLSHGSFRFRVLARDAGAAEVLREIAESGSERAREKARKVLEGLKVPEEEADPAPPPADGEEVDWEAVMKDGVTRARQNRTGRRNSA